MGLKEIHLKLLELDSGIDKELATAFRLASSTKGIDFQYLNFEGKVIGKRTKLVPPIQNYETGKKVRYIQGKNSKLTCYFCKEDIPRILDSNIPLYITEGEKKAISLKGLKELREKPVVSYPGCWNWGRKNLNGELVLSDEWLKIPFFLREVIWLPDTDFYTNYHAHQGMMRFCLELKKKGAMVSLVDLRGGRDGR